MSPDHRVLVLLAHPALEKSAINAPLARTAAAIDGVTVHDLYETYPDFCIDKEREQRQILEHEVLVLQHPLYWYSVPSLLKEWCDIVMEYGFAYGENARGLKDRTLLNAISAGSTREEFETSDRIATVDQLMAPFASTAHYCGMRYLSPFVTYATGSLTTRSITQARHEYGQLLGRLTTRNYLAEAVEHG